MSDKILIECCSGESKQFAKLQLQNRRSEQLFHYCGIRPEDKQYFIKLQVLVVERKTMEPTDC